MPFAELCPLKHLRELDLDGNRLTGPIPDWAPGRGRVDDDDDDDDDDDEDDASIAVRASLLSFRFVAPPP